MRFMENLNLTAWAASKFASMSPPIVQPPGKGKEPGHCAVGETQRKVWQKRAKT